MERKTGTGVQESTFARCLRFWLAYLERSAASVARGMGISESKISRWRSGAGPRQDELEQLAAELGLTVPEFLQPPAPEKRSAQ